MTSPAPKDWIITVDNLAELDRTHAMGQHMSEIYGLIGDRIQEAGDVFFDTYIDMTGLRTGLGPDAQRKIRQDAALYVEEKLRNYVKGRWIDKSTACVRQAAKRGVSVRAVLSAVSRSNEKISSLLCDACWDDRPTCERLLRTLNRASMVDASVIGNLLAHDDAEAQRSERQRYGAVFEQRIVSEI
nr:chemotaxis protein [Sphingobium sp.]